MHFREKGGAYGGGASSQNHGLFHFYSYRLIQSNIFAVITIIVIILIIIYIYMQFLDNR